VAFAVLRGAGAAGGALLSDAGRDALRAAVTAWDGSHPPATWIEQRVADLPEADLPAARLAVLAALSPQAITDADVAAWRATGPTSDADLVHLLGFGAITAVDRIEQAITGRVATGGR